MTENAESRLTISKKTGAIILTILTILYPQLIANIEGDSSGSTPQGNPTPLPKHIPDATATPDTSSFNYESNGIEYKPDWNSCMPLSGFTYNSEPYLTIDKRTNRVVGFYEPNDPAGIGAISDATAFCRLVPESSSTNDGLPLAV